MRYLLFVSHGTFASGMAEALGMLVGKRDDVLQVAFQDGMGLPAFKEEVEKTIAPIEPEDELLILADLVSGSPLATTMDAVAQKLGLANVRATGGMNLPMAVTAVECEDDPLDEAFDAMLECAKEQVRPFGTEDSADDEI